MLQASRRLPGIRFEAEPPPPAIVLPRMDVAGFVGYAASGPLDVPVPVEDPAQFADVFGGDVDLGWDTVRDEAAFAALGPCVRSFFRNGGRRCFVVRVAGESAARAETRFELPGLVAVSDRKFSHALLRVRSPGSWADGLSAAVSVAVTGLAVRPVDFAHGVLDVTPPPGGALATGDMIRLTLRSGWTLTVTVGTARAEARHSESSLAAGDVRVSADQRAWTRPRPVRPGTAGTAHWIGSTGVEQEAAWSAVADGDTTRIRIGRALERAPHEGSMLRLGRRSGGLWAQVRSRRPEGTTTLLDLEAVQVSATPPRRLPAPARMAAELLELELWTRGTAPVRRVAALGFGRGHPRYLGDLPADSDLYRDFTGAGRGGTELARLARDPRFPLAGPPLPPPNDDGPRPATTETGGPWRPEAYLPLFTPVLPDPWLGALVPAGSARRRDGLTTFDPAHFLDPELRGVRVHALVSQADHLRYSEGKDLRGIHALLGIEDVTMVAAPDTVHVGWDRLRHPRPPEAPAKTDEPVAEHDGLFEACDPDVLPTPELVLKAGVISWTPPPRGAWVVLEEAQDELFESAIELYRGDADSLALGVRPPGRRFYRARYRDAEREGAWSTTLVVGQPMPRPFVLRKGGDGPDRSVAAVHRSLLRMCAARGDLLAVLSLPRHYREDQAVGHADALLRPSVPATPDDPPLGEGEAQALSYGALYHPWLLAAGEERRTDLRRQPPDGAIAGQFAREAIARGAWIAPAGDAFRDVVAVAPELAAGRRLDLLVAQVNVVERTPRGFLTLGADTLSRDSELRPVNVRRLLQLLRRLALRHGETYAFEPNGEPLRRAAQRGFEAVLGALFRLGAFSGARPDQAFRVEVGSPPNTRASIDAGRLVVELKVAPSRPLSFLTVRVVRAGDGRVRVETI